MRVNFRKLTIAVGAGVLIWFLAAYKSIIDVSRPVGGRNNVVEIESKMETLQKRVDDQVADSKQLLETIKKHLKKKEYMRKEVKQDAGDLKTTEPVLDLTRTILPVLVIACDRVTVKRCLDNLVKFRPNKETFPIIVSQDCGHEPTYKVIKTFIAQDPTITVIQQPDLSEIALPRAKVKFRGYYKVARHFKFALNHVFNTLGHDAVIIVEDDLDVSPDFFEYFLGTYPLLHKDPSLWCISAWNDNGKKAVADMKRPDLLHRTDFFPGLGWMLRKEMWTKLEPKWPPAFFDDWLRNPENIEGKACIRPEISRTYSFGKVGVSKGLFFDVHLKNIQLNMEYVEFTKLNLTYLLKENYDEALESIVDSLPEMSLEEVLTGSSEVTACRIMYHNAKNYQRTAKALGLMDDFRSGVPRTAYRGIVSCYIRGRRVYLVPATPWRRYEPSWG